MPEGPSIVILKEKVRQFTGMKIIAMEGNSKIDKNRFVNLTVTDFKSWGKHFLICFEDLTIRIHLMMFGSYEINEQKDRPARLSLKFENGEINFYSCSVKIIEEAIDQVYDFSSDVMSDAWDPGKAKKKLKASSADLICDALLNQEIFSGVGNIIKNEVLYRIRVHPESTIGKIPARKITSLVNEARKYSFDFLEWKKKYELKKHWLAYAKKVCLRCNLPIIRKHTGLKHRRSFFCINCQKLYI